MNLQSMAKTAKKRTRNKAQREDPSNNMRGEKSGYKLKVNSTNHSGESFASFPSVGYRAISLHRLNQRWFEFFNGCFD